MLKVLSPTTPMLLLHTSPTVIRIPPPLPIIYSIFYSQLPKSHLLPSPSISSLQASNFCLTSLGDVDPIRDLSIISSELRIKDIEFVEKHLEALKKITNRGGQSLEVKQKKEEEAIVMKVLKCLQEEKDVRKGEWNNKEV